MIIKLASSASKGSLSMGISNMLLKSHLGSVSIYITNPCLSIIIYLSLRRAGEELNLGAISKTFKTFSA